jgi:oxalate decarboxylase/phosphoglucose isomerase-like protein (cupin superfamily)
VRIQTEPVIIHSDTRGALTKAWPGPVSGEVYTVELLPGHPRGHHYHRNGGEWFVPLQGVARLILEDPATGQRAEVRLEGIRARVEAGIAHTLIAADEAPALVLAIADCAWQDEETIPYPVAL